MPFSDTCGKSIWAPPTPNSFLAAGIGVDEMTRAPRQDETLAIPVLEERGPPFEVSGGFLRKAALGAWVCGGGAQGVKEIEEVAEEWAAQGDDSGAE
jgi:hypothetical protein